MIEKKSKIQQALDSLEGAIRDAIIFLKKPFDDTPPRVQRLYTEEELKQLYGIKKDIDRYPKRHQEW